MDKFLLKEVREKKGLTIAELSKKSGVNRSTVAMLDSGERKYPRIDTAVRLADALGVSINELFEIEEDEE